MALSPGAHGRPKSCADHVPIHGNLYKPLPRLPSMCVNRALASSAALAASRGRRNTLGDDSMAATDRISLEHLAVCIKRKRGGAEGAGEGGPTEEQGRTLSGPVRQGKSGPVRLLFLHNTRQLISTGAANVGSAVAMCNATIPELRRGDQHLGQLWVQRELGHDVAHLGVCARAERCVRRRRPVRCAVHPWAKGLALSRKHTGKGAVKSCMRLPLLMRVL